MLTTIWERYLIKQFLSIFFLFLFCFYGLYILIDYASHTSNLSSYQIHMQWKEIFQFYLFLFASRAEILLPLALIISFVKTVTTLNANQELIALMAGGIKLKTLMRPFLLVATFCILCLYCNEQFFLPHALKKLRKIEDATKHRKTTSLNSVKVNHILLEDGSLIIYQNYDSFKERFFDVYWIQSIDQIYRMKFLFPYLVIPKGIFVDKFVRQQNGDLLQEAAYKQKEFPEIPFNKEILQSAIIDSVALSISDLAAQSSKMTSSLDEKESRALTAFYWKLMIPFLCLLAVIAPAPYCVYFSRQRPIFLIYVCNLFGLIAFYMLMDAAKVTTNRQILDPFWAICFPFILSLTYFGHRFYKLQTS